MDRSPPLLVAFALAGCPKVESTPPSAPTDESETTAPRSSTRERPPREEPAATGERGRLEGLTAAHNAERAKVGVAPLSWSPALARHAQAWADRLAKRDCALDHRTDDRYGENLYWTSGTASASAVVAKWADEATHYVHRTNSCKGVCGHYTQMVWSETRSLGCGAASCGDAEIWVCNYDPPGNVVGQKPY